MSGFWTHFRVRLTTVLREPFSLIVLILSAGATLFWWPDPTVGVQGPLGDRSVEGGDIFFLWAIGMTQWIWLWPYMAVGQAAGRVAGGGRVARAFGAMPALPVGLRTRMAAEALLVLAFVLVVRAGAWFFVDALAQPRFLRITLMATLVILPMVLAWTTPARKMEHRWARTGCLAALYLIMLMLGVLSSVFPCVLVCAGLIALLLLTADRELRWPFQGGRDGGPESRWRPGLEPQTRLWRDWWVQPIARQWGFLVATLAIGVPAIVLTQMFEVPRILQFLPINMTFVFLFVFIALRPFGSKSLIAGILGHPSYRAGELMEAFGRLPVRRVSVLRGVYLHGLLTTGSAYAVLVAYVLTKAWLRTGALSLADKDGELWGWLLIPSAALIPCIAGALTSSAMGWKPHAITTMVLILFFLHGYVIMRILKAPDLIIWGCPIAMALIGGLPPLRHLWGPRPGPAADRPVTPGEGYRSPRPRETVRPEVRSEVVGPSGVVRLCGAGF